MRKLEKYKMAQKDNSKSKFLTACLCKLQLPHEEGNVNALPKPVMPTLRLPKESYSIYDPALEQTKRVQELLTDVDAARAEDLQLQRKFDKDAEELLKSYEEGLKCKHWEPKKSDESERDSSAARLKYELEHSRFQLAEVRNQLHTLKREMSAYEKLVKQELGDNVTLHEVLTSSRWRGRAQEIQRLKKEIADMESKAYDYKYLKNPLCIPSYKPRFPDVNDLIPRTQMQALQKVARKKTELRQKTEEEVTALIEQYGNISLMYKASLTQNKMLAEELRSLKDQLAKYETQDKEDRELMKNLISHQMQMREMVDREAHLARLVKSKQQAETELDDESALDAAKYKALWEASESEKLSLEKMIEMLTRRLDGISEMAEEAEKHCADNEARRQELEQQIETQKKLPDITSKSKEPKLKSSRASAQSGSSFLQTGVQLEAVKEENTFLRNFILRAIETKVEDLKLYQFTMNSIREQYAETLKKLKSPPEEANGEINISR